MQDPAMMEGWLTSPGSSRPASVARILIALTLWCEHGPELRLFNTFDWDLAAFSLLFFALSTWMLVGWKARLATGATGVLLVGGWLAFGLTHRLPYIDHHHTYLLGVATLLLALLPCGGSYSIDRLLAVRAARAAGVEPPAEWGDLWAVRLFQLQLAAVYLYGAYDKTYLTFPERMESYYAYMYFGAEHPGVWFEWLMVALGVGTIVLEYVLAVGFLFRRAIPAMIVLGVILHFLIYWTLTVGTFTVLMYVFYFLLLDPAWVHRVLGDATG